jgi:hypothetical protein
MIGARAFGRTPLSRWPALAAAISRHLSVVARSSQGRASMVAPVLASLLASGCLIPEAPEYGPPQQTPIFIIDSSVSPNPRNLQTLSVIEDEGSYPFSFKVRSEDANQEVVAALFTDYKDDRELFVYQVNYEPGSFDVEKSIVLYMTIPDARIMSPGCHTATLMVLHEAGWNDKTKQLIGSPADLASVTWFFSLEDGTAKKPLLSDCP